MFKYLLSAILPVFLFTLNAAAQQIDIPRVEMMPNMPQPYEMRDWKTVAHKYDSLVFDLDATGLYLPLTTIIQNTVNYPDHPSFGIQSYVGTNSPPGREAINIIPAVISAGLNGIDKTSQFGYDWALMCEEFFNKRPEENVYLNGPVASSGYDWWYETMPNVFFYQLNYLYPGTGDFDYQFVTVADQWLKAVRAMGGNDAPWEAAYMNYRAFSLSTMTPLESGVKEPEAAGAIGWILYSAYQATGNEEYRKGAEWCMEFLDGWSSNPAYEIQLPYGVYAAARMNAELGTDYDVEKMLNWCFDITPLRQWGAVIEAWGGIDVHGLIGEARVDYPGYAFNMNGTEQASALVPMVRYDDRFARAIGKWTLNVANATRLFYSQFLPEDMQDNEDWTNAYDLQSVIAYEALREYPEGPYGTGDAVGGGWAETNLGLYGASHVGIFGALIQTTDVEGILRLDLLATDYYRNEAYPSYLLYNPHNEIKTVQVNLPGGPYDIYDALSNLVIATNVSENASINIAGDTPVIAVLIPAGSVIDFELNKALVNQVIIDYNAEMQVDNFPPRIKAVAASDTVYQSGFDIGLFCEAEDRETEELEYRWAQDGVYIGSGKNISLPAPDETGMYTFKCTVRDEGEATAADSVTVEVVEFINYPPQIEKLTAYKRYIETGDTTQITCAASDLNNEPLSFSWSANGGSVSGTGSTVVFTAPAIQGGYTVNCIVEDTSGSTASAGLSLLVKDPANNQSGDLVASYEFNGNVLDLSGYGHDGIPSAIEYSEDMHGTDGQALSLPFSDSKVTVGTTGELNFREGLTLTCWLYIDRFFDRESYPVSHGNWTTRWKTSLTNENLRFTLNGEGGITDLDSESTLAEDRWYHIAAVYDGYFCQVFIDGKLDAFTPYQGLINTTPYDLVMGQSLPDQTGYNFEGRLDKLKIYNYGIAYEKLREIYEDEYFSIGEKHPDNSGFLTVFPNPATSSINVKIYSPEAGSGTLTLLSSGGKIVYQARLDFRQTGTVEVKIPVGSYHEGLYLLRFTSNKGSVSRKFVIAG